MEFVVVLVLIGLVGFALFAISQSPASMSSGTEKYRSALKGAIRQGKYSRFEELLSALPKWDTTKAIRAAVKPLRKLVEGAPTAIAAGLPPEQVEPITQRALEGLDGLAEKAVKIQSIVLYAGSKKSRELSQYQTEQFERDRQEIEELAQSASKLYGTVSDSISGIRSGSTSGDLERLSLHLRELTNATIALRD